MKWIFSGTSTWNPDSSKLIKKIDYVYSSSTEGMAWKDLMTKYDGKTITYDSIGNPTSYMGSSITWEGRTLVEQIKNGTTITYSYDSSDMRTSKTVGGVKHNYYYVEGKLMYEDCPSYKLFYAYDANGFLSGIKRVKSNGTTDNFGVHCNIFGDVIAIYEQGVLIAKYSYDSWGKLISVTESNGLDVTGDNDIWTQNSIRYRGYVYDEETQLYYLQSRYYDATTGRFINADDYSVLTASPTALTDKNLFAYCDCNPIIRIDTKGDFWGAIIGGTLGFITNAIDVAIKGYSSDVVIKVALVGLITGAVSGLVCDICVASGGTLAFIGTSIANGAFDTANYAISTLLCGEKVKASEIALTLTTGTLSGALSFGLSGGSLTKSTEKILPTLKKDFVNFTTPKPKKYHGKTRVPTKSARVIHTLKNIAYETSTSIVISGGSSIASLYAKYWGK